MEIIHLFVNIMPQIVKSQLTVGKIKQAIFNQSIIKLPAKCEPDIYKEGFQFPYRFTMVRARQMPKTKPVLVLGL